MNKKNIMGLKITPVKFKIEDDQEHPRYIRRIAVDNTDLSKGFYWVIEGSTGDYWFHGDKNKIVDCYWNIPSYAKFKTPEEALATYIEWNSIRVERGFVGGFDLSDLDIEALYKLGIGPL